MKRNPSQPRRPALKSLGIALLAASLVAGPGIAGTHSGNFPLADADVVRYRSACGGPTADHTIC